MNAPLEELVRALGLPAALRLAERFGGTRVYLPRPEAMHVEHPVAAAVGLEAARALCRLWRQEQPYIPRALLILRHERDRALLEDAGELSVARLARKYGLAERQVYYILARGLPEDPAAAAASSGQKTLF